MPSRQHKRIADERRHILRKWFEPQRGADLLKHVQLARIHAKGDIDILGQARLPMQQHSLAANQHERELTAGQLPSDASDEGRKIRGRAGGH